MRTKTPAQSEKILTVAARLFAQHRFHEARMEDIAAVAGVGKGTLYRYFQDKEELYLALLSRAAEQLLGRVHEAADGAGGPRARLEAIVAAILTYFDEQPHLFDLIQHAEAMQRHGSKFPWQKARDENVQLIRQVFREGQEQGVFRVACPDLAVLMLLGGLRAVIRFGPQPRPPDLARQIIDQFLFGAAEPGAGQSSRLVRKGERGL